MPAGPVFICYSKPPPLSWAKPGAIFVPDQHRNLPLYQDIRRAGGAVNPYLDMAESHIRGAMDRGFRDFVTGVVGGTPPLWGNGRKSYYPLTDIRVGSPYVRLTVDYIVEKIMPNFDGITLDVVGGQLHNRADWDNWPESEKAEWRAGSIDFLRLLDKKRLEIKPWFTINTINIWHETKEGYKYIDGFFVESPMLGVGQFYRNLVKDECSYLGQRRVMVIADTIVEARAYAELPGVTHVTAVARSLNQSYAAATPAVMAEWPDYRLREAINVRDWLHNNTWAGDEGEITRLQEALDSALSDMKVLDGRVNVLKGKLTNIKTKVDEELEGVE